MLFPPIKELSGIAENILQKRYFHENEKDWEETTTRIVEYILQDVEDTDSKELTYYMILNRYFIPNSPCIVNAGVNDGGLLACFVVDFPDSLEGIYKTKHDFGFIAKKGGGCGTTLTKLRPKNSKVNGGTHGHAGGPVDFYNTICHDMEVLTQGGFRAMAQMGTMS